MVNPTSLKSGGKAADLPGAGDTARSGAVAAPPRVQARQQLNTAIVQASMSVAISSGNEPLALLYKSALTGINEALAPDFGPDAIQNAMGQDNTPEGTAGRIVSLSTAFFDAFKAQNKGMDEEAALQKFMDTIQGGVEQGFKEARGILEGLQVLKGDIAGNIDKTYELVQQGLQQFADSKRAPPAAANDTNNTNDIA
ncbi:hypothetical protein ASC94_24650 [Massilia sp. Root418]|uniref:DUF5610 domain-containing protein n=1 Tax=Massilia sp. Root418 TaxID=1736532 RepID=UPI0006F2247E|nr:DUF5610 domain-containing protein [Massilia sp. Root418]KQW88597.1 hypothetical protein ASC94_24650 [Massilia sp. Root418]